MLTDFDHLEDSAEELIQFSGDEEPSWLVVDRSQLGDSVVLTSPQLPLLIPELNEADCILARIWNCDRIE